MRAETLQHETYNVSSGRPIRNREFVDALRSLTPGLGSASCPDARTAPARTPTSTSSGSTRDTGFTPAFDVATAVADYVAWRADNPR